MDTCDEPNIRWLINKTCVWYINYSGPNFLASRLDRYYVKHSPKMRIFHIVVFPFRWFSVWLLALLWLIRGVRRRQWRGISSSWCRVRHSWNASHRWWETEDIEALLGSPSRVPSSCGCMSIVIAPRQMLILPFGISIQTCCKIFLSVPIIWMSLRVSFGKAIFWQCSGVTMFLRSLTCMSNVLTGGCISFHARYRWQ